jgi:hypothetical protein
VTQEKSALLNPQNRSSLQRLGLIILLLVPCYLLGCVTGDNAVPIASYRQEGPDGYCHMKLQPVGPTDIVRPTESRAGDYIDYSGSCAGPSLDEQIRKQRRFETFRFGRDFMPG